MRKEEKDPPDRKIPKVLGGGEKSIPGGKRSVMNPLRETNLEKRGGKKCWGPWDIRMLKKGVRKRGLKWTIILKKKGRRSR